MLLIISKSKKEARAMAEMFHYMGIISHGATPVEALSEISNLYNAVIIINPDVLSSPDDFCRRLRSYASVPIFAVAENCTVADSIIFDGIIKRTSYASSIFKFISEYAYSNSLRSPGDYKLAGIDAAVDISIPMYFNKPLPFTKTETMILRTLIATYPTPKPPQDILKYAFKESKTPELSNIRTHISVMNKKFREITGRNIITLSVGEGYRILTPELISTV